MKKVTATPSWGVTIIEDDATGEVSLQCVCGGIGMYYRRVILTPEEAEELRAGSFDFDRMVREVCRETELVRERLVPSIPEE